MNPKQSKIICTHAKDRRLHRGSIVSVCNILCARLWEGVCGTAGGQNKISKFTVAASRKAHVHTFSPVKQLYNILCHTQTAATHTHTHAVSSQQHGDTYTPVSPPKDTHTHWVKSYNNQARSHRVMSWEAFNFIPVKHHCIALSLFSLPPIPCFVRLHTDCTHSNENRVRIGQKAHVMSCYSNNKRKEENRENNLPLC